MSLTRKTSTVAASLLASASLMAEAADDNPLVAERWRTRPLVVVAPAPDHSMVKGLRAQLQDTVLRAAFAERDMVLFTVMGGEGRRDAQAMTTKQTQGLLAALGASADGPATAFLIGKDGGVKLSERGERIELEKVFALIDTMPMRQR